MKKHTRIGLIILITLVLLLSLTITGMAAKSNRFTLTAILEVDTNSYTAEGTFEADFDADGKPDDNGIALAHWNPYWGRFKGTTTFVSESGDKFVIWWSLSEYEDGCASGNFRFYPTKSTGKYEGIWGGGRITSCRIGVYLDRVDLVGTAFFQSAE